MKLHHIALVSSSEEKSDWFYRDVLGLEKKSARQIPADLMTQIFNIDKEARLINYSGSNGLLFEIFVTPVRENVPVSHACLIVDDREAFLENCQQMDVPVHRIPRGDGTFIVFVNDGDDNLFEIK
jgi:catechol 2,3-dioxygenase-like lactoylglutathione lyase family enzyme